MVRNCILVITRISMQTIGSGSRKWAGRLSFMLEGFLVEGMVDGSIVECEPHIVVQLLLGMLIWLGKWVPLIEGMTVDRLMAAIGVASLDGLGRR